MDRPARTHAPFSSPTDAAGVHRFSELQIPHRISSTSFEWQSPSPSTEIDSIRSTSKVINMSSLSSAILFLVFVSSSKCFGQESGTINFGGSPNLNDEESASFHMPESLKCDGCQILAHLFFEEFHKAEQKVARGRQLSESEILDATDRVCESDFKEYGVTDWNGRKRMKGPGLDTDNVPGVAQSGGKWPMRLQQFCTSYVGELGEDYLYRKYRRAIEKSNDRNGWSKTFRTFLCEESGPRFSHCKTKKSASKEL